MRTDIYVCPLCQVEWDKHARAPYPYDGYKCDRFEDELELGVDAILGWASRNNSIDDND